MYEAGDHTVEEIAAEFGVSRPTIYRHLDSLAASDALKAKVTAGAAGEPAEPSTPREDPR